MTLRAQDVLAIIVTFHLSHGSNTSCRHTFESPWGRVRSPDYPKPYPAGVSCQWHINMANVTNATGVTLFIKHFSTQSTNSAALFEEELLIYAENPTSANATPSVYNGRDSVYTWHHNQLWLQFSAADNVTLPRTTGPSLGFDILFSAVIQGTFCEDPGAPLNTIRVGNNFTVGSYVSYYCNHGSRVSGSSLIFCLLNDSRPAWSEDPPSCVDTCVAPTLEHGRTSYVNLKVNSTVSFSCNPPYRLTGSESLVCTLDNGGNPSWNGAYPKCELFDCSRLEVLTDPRGAVVNPGYGDGVVQAGVTCQWKLVVRSGFVIKLYFRYFDLPSGGRVEIADTGRGRVLLLTASGGGQPPNVTSSTNQVEILYHGPHANSNASRGFYLQYMMSSPRGLQQDPGHSVPTGRTGGTISLWTVQTTLIPPSTRPTVTRKPDDNNGVDTTKIAIGVSIPAVLLLLILLGLYLWYRKKYPVRMIIGREFAKFSNPEYTQKGNSTLTLVRDDADEFFETASRATSHVSLVRDEEHGPRFVEADMRKGENSEECKVIDQDEEDRELIKRKSYLFTNLNLFDETDTGEGSSIESETRSVGMESQGSKASTKVSFRYESETGSGGEASQTSVGPESVTVVERSDSVTNDTNKPVMEAYADAVHSFNSKFPSEFPRKVSVDILLERSRDRRAFTNEEVPSRRFSIDTTLSVRGRSLSAKTPSEVSKEATKLTALLRLSTVKGSTEDQLQTKLTIDSMGEQNDHKTSQDPSERDSDKRTSHKESENEIPIADCSAAEKTKDSGPGDEPVIEEPSVREDKNSDETDDKTSDTSSEEKENVHHEPAADDDSEKLAFDVISSVTSTETPDLDENGVRRQNNSEEANGDSNESAPVRLSVTENINDSVIQGASKVREDESEDMDERNKLSEHFVSSDVPENREEVTVDEGDEPDTPSITSKLVSKETDERTLDLESDTTESGNPFEDNNRDSLEFSKEASNLSVHETDAKDASSDESSSDEMDIDKAIAEYKGSVLESVQSKETIESTLASEEETTSRSSTTSHVSASYNFASSGDELAKENEHVSMTIDNDIEQTSSNNTDNTNMVDMKVDDSEINISSDNDVSANTDQVSRGSKIKPEEGDDLAESKTEPENGNALNESKSKHENASIGSSINLDTSSLSSFDTSIDLSVSSADSPLPRHRLPESSKDQPRKLAAPVFNVDDDDDDNDSDTSSSEADDNDASKHRQTLASTMPGIEEESDTDDGRSRSYDVSGIAKQESDSDEENGLKFTHEDLLAELSDESSEDEKPDSRKDPGLASNVFVFSDKEDDDDLDV